MTTLPTIPVLMLALVVIGCATMRASTARPGEGQEWQKLRSALQAILPASGVWTHALSTSGGIFPGCPSMVAKTLADHVDMIGSNRGVVANPMPCDFMLFITSGALEQLPVSELEAALAHELGHVMLGHAKKHSDQIKEKCEGAVLLSQCYGSVDNVYAAYSIDQEREADAYAVGLLRRISPTETRCRNLVSFVRRQTRSSISPPLTQAHPPTATRLQDLEKLCP